MLISRRARCIHQLKLFYLTGIFAKCDYILSPAKYVNCLECEAESRLNSSVQFECLSFYETNNASTDKLSANIVLTQPDENQAINLKVGLRGRMINTGTSRRFTMTKYKFLIALVGLGLLFTACSAGKTPTAATPKVIPPVLADTSIIAEGRLEPVRYVEIASNVNSVIGEVMVEEGQAVKKGEPILRLGGELDGNYAAAQLELANAQKALNDLLNTSDADLAKAVIDLKQAKEDYKDAVVRLDYLKNSKKVPITETFVYYFTTHKGIDLRYRFKNHKGPAPEAWIVHAENDLALKKAKLEEAQNTYDRMKDYGVDRDQLAVLKARLDAANAKVSAFSVTAPFDGTVTDLNAKLGNSINVGEPAVTIADFSSWLVKTTDLTEIDVVALAAGQPATVILDALPGAELKGTIQSIGQTYSENQGDVVYEVTILLTDTHPAMRWGMTAAVTFELDT